MTIWIIVVPCAVAGVRAAHRVRLGPNVLASGEFGSGDG